MTKEYYINEEGFSCYKLECGCEGVNIPNIGWLTTPCSEHEVDEENIVQPTVTPKFKKRYEI